MLSGYAINRCTLKDEPTPGQDIVAAMDLAGPFFHQLDERNLALFTKFLGKIKDCGILWVTGSCQVACKDPRYAMVLGVSRVIRTEMELHFATLELESFESEAMAVIPRVFTQFNNRISQEDLEPTMEWAYANGSVQTGRYHWIQVKSELMEKPAEDAVRKLGMRQGAQDSMCWNAASLKEPEGDEVEIDVRAVGLNFKVYPFCIHAGSS